MNGSKVFLDRFISAADVSDERDEKFYQFLVFCKFNYQQKSNFVHSTKTEA